MGFVQLYLLSVDVGAETEIRCYDQQNEGDDSCGDGTNTGGGAGAAVVVVVGVMRPVSVMVAPAALVVVMI